jgi:hypothetical protein
MVKLTSELTTTGVNALEAAGLIGRRRARRADSRAVTSHASATTRLGGFSFEGSLCRGAHDSVCGWPA